MEILKISIDIIFEIENKKIVKFLEKFESYLRNQIFFLYEYSLIMGYDDIEIFCVAWLRFNRTVFLWFIYLFIKSLIITMFVVTPDICIFVHKFLIHYLDYILFGIEDVMWTFDVILLHLIICFFIWFNWLCIWFLIKFYINLNRILHNVVFFFKNIVSKKD